MASTTRRPSESGPVAHGCCSHATPNGFLAGSADAKGVSRRDFLLSLGAAGLGAWAISSPRKGFAQAGSSGGMAQIGSALKVKPALVYEFYQRREATSWRSWGGLKTQADVDQEINRIQDELKNLAAKSDFPIEILPIAPVKSGEQAAAVRDADCDVILLYAGIGGGGHLETIASSKKPNVMFLRHKSGPIYLWYEIAHPHFLRKATDEYKQPRMDVWDVVVDKYDEVLWRLRALYGLKNALGTKILAIGDASGWGVGYELGPKTAREIWKLDIKPVTYADLKPMIEKVRADEKAVQEAERQANEFLAQDGISLNTDKKFVVNAFLLTKVFKDLMQQAGANAITVNSCMGTIMPMAQTTACLPLSLLNDEGLMAFCESDFVVIPSGILLRHISGKPMFFNDPTYIYDGITTIAHCTGPRRMNGKDFEPTEIHTHFESDYGAAPKVNMRKGQVITNLIPDFASKKWVGCRGKIIDHPFYDICRCQVDIEIEGDWKKLLEDMRGFHWMTCYGDYTREVGYALKKLGIGWENVTDRSTA